MRAIYLLLVPFFAFANFEIIPNEVASSNITTSSVSLTATIYSNGSLSGDIYLWYGEGDSLSNFQSVGFSVFQNVTFDGVTIGGSLSGLSPNTQYSFKWILANSAGQIIYTSETTSFVTKSNSPPTDIFISSIEISEDSEVGSVVGSLSTSDIDSGDQFTYSLVSGDGDSGNSNFSINGNNLLTASTFDAEITPSYSIRIQTDDGNGGVYTKSFTITIIPNASPTDIYLSSTSINEGLDSNTQVAVLSTEDSDNDVGFIYSLVSGSGDTDNTVFDIVDDNLLALEVFDYESVQSYSIRIKSLDTSGGSIEKEFTININDMDHENGIAFSSDLSNLDGWLIQDFDGDGQNFIIFGGGGGEDWGFNPGPLAGSQSTGFSPDNTLMTPIITIPSGSSDINYSMRVAASSADNFAEKFSVYVYEISTSDPFENLIYDETLDVGGFGTSKIINATIDNNFAGKNIRIYIRHHDTVNQGYLFVDDFEITYEGSLDIEEQTINPLVLYPNPANSIVRIVGNDQYYIEIYNYIGQKLLEINGNSIDVSSLPNAVYVVKATNKSTNKQLTSKLIKN